MLKILYEDNHIIVVLKPQNVPTQPDSSTDTDLLSMVKAYVKEKYNKPGEAFVGLVHRLDRPTGGVMVFAKTSKAAARLSEQLKDGVMQKKYVTVVQGTPKSPREHLVNYLKKNEKDNMVMVVPQTVEGAKIAELEYRLLDSVSNYSLLEVNLFTGRSHQIRVQLKHIGHPVFADTKYGATPQKAHLALWAYELKLEHPITKVQHTFKVFPPLDTLPWKMFENATVFNS